MNKSNYKIYHEQMGWLSSSDETGCVVFDNEEREAVVYQNPRQAREALKALELYYAFSCVLVESSVVRQLAKRRGNPLEVLSKKRF